jgi:hypothetical protein
LHVPVTQDLDSLHDKRTEVDLGSFGLPVRRADTFDIEKNPNHFAKPVSLPLDDTGDSLELVVRQIIGLQHFTETCN